MIIGCLYPQPGSFEDKYYFYHYDARGSTTAILEPSGSLIKGYEYDEFGGLEEKGNASFLNNVTYTGSVTDESTGLQYMNARFYNPKTGRFLSQDTYTGSAYDPWTQHLYAYCGNNPVNMVDPTGHFPQGTGGSGTLPKKGDRYIKSIGPNGRVYATAGDNMAGNDGGVIYSGGATVPAASVEDTPRERLNAVGEMYGAQKSDDGNYSLLEVARAYVNSGDYNSIGTFHIGVGASGSFAALGGQATIQLVFDGYGNVQIQTTLGGGLGVAAAMSGSLFVFAGGTNANRTTDLLYEGVQSGVSGGAGFAGGGEYIFGCDPMNSDVKTFEGGEGWFGFGAGAEGHAFVTYTNPVNDVPWSIFDSPMAEGVFRIIEDISFK